MTIRMIRTHRRAGLGLVALLLAAIGVGAVLAPRVADASALAGARPSAVAMIDLAKLLDGLDERSAMEQDLNKQIAKRQAELDAAVAEVKSMQDEVDVLSEKDPNRIEKIRNLQLKKVEANALKQFIQEQLSLEKGQRLADLFEKVQDAVGQIALRDGWDIVLIDDSGLDVPQMANEQQMLQVILARRVIYANDSVEITDEVKTLMNNQFNAAAP
ncbi:MAG: OmpH family outer membrane protein [Phycisphaeraceae bacterium]|nr:MAG: OmpH family outer membrane protein [Phycisphaeraceae bacterium]